MKKECVYCSSSEINHGKIIENKLAYAFPAKRPIGVAHLLIVTKRCVKTFDDLTKKEIDAIFDLRKKLKVVLEKVFDAEGFNYAWNENEIGGQTVPHFHLHIIPRKKGDSGIYEYEPKNFLYRPGDKITKTPEEELQEITKILKENL